MLTLTEQQKFMKVALDLAKTAISKNEVPVAALVLHNGEIVSSAINMRLSESDPTAHAEVLALRDAGKKLGRWNLSGCDLLVTLEPCAMCAGAIVNSRIDNVYYGAYDCRYGYCGSLGNIATDERLNHRANVVGGIMELECAEILKNFFKARRKSKMEN
ncbi:MAG: tRNA adenosine(34) deaminase TadA [Firmicutes bacterium]|nr:tRNA adenosine(34) deaminase TadA [Bacillota bacterium]